MSFGSFGSGSGGQGSFSFGSAASQPATSTFGQSLFGSSPSPFASSAPASSSSFPSTGFSFGSSSAAPSFGGFGSQSQPAFGSFGSSSLLGSASSSASSSSPFASSSLFAPLSTGSSAQPQPQPQQADATASSLLVRQLLELKQAYDPSSPACRFQTVFYNKIPPSSPAALRVAFVAPANASPALWQRATRSNPDPSTLTPSLAVGFDDLLRRVEAQRRARAVHEEAVAALRSSVEELAAVHDGFTAERVRRLRDTQEEQRLRVLRVVNRLLMLEARGLPFMREEAEYRDKVEALALSLQREGWMEQAAEMQRRVRLGAGRAAAAGGAGGAALTLSAADVEKLRVIIDTQTRALDFLVDVVKQDRQTLQQTSAAAAAANAERDGADAAPKQQQHAGMDRSRWRLSDA